MSVPPPPPSTHIQMSCCNSSKSSSPNGCVLNLMLAEWVTGDTMACVDKCIDLCGQSVRKCPAVWALEEGGWAKNLWMDAWMGARSAAQRHPSDRAEPQPASVHGVSRGLCTSHSWFKITGHCGDKTILLIVEESSAVEGGGGGRGCLNCVMVGSCDHLWIFLIRNGCIEAAGDSFFCCGNTL